MHIMTPIHWISIDDLRALPRGPVRSPVTRMRKVFPGFLNRSHRSYVTRQMWLELFTSVDPYMFLTGKRCPLP